jgi:hypothetical protein
VAKKNSSKSNFISFKAFVFLTLLIALPILVWSVAKAPTETKQNAATICAGEKGTCVMSGRECNTGYINNALTCETGICCAPAPTHTPK